MSSKLKEDDEIVQNLDHFMDDDFTLILKLFLFAFNIKKEVCGVLDIFLSFLKKYEEKKTHNMLLLTLDPQFKSRRNLVSSFIGHEQSIFIIEKYDRKSL
jgi:hypothetical protein